MGSCFLFHIAILLIQLHKIKWIVFYILFSFSVIGVNGLKILINNFVYDAELQTLWMIQLETHPLTFFSQF